MHGNIEPTILKFTPEGQRYTVPYISRAKKTSSKMQQSITENDQDEANLGKRLHQPQSDSELQANVKRMKTAEPGPQHFPA